MTATIVQLAEAIAQTVPGWSEDVEEGADPTAYRDPDWRGLTHENGLTLSLRAEWNSKDKVTAHLGGYPKTSANRYAGYNIDTPPSMKASLHRGNQAIIGDIQRKLIRPGMIALDKYRIAVRKINAEEANHQHAHNMIAALPQVRYSDQSDEFYGPSIRLRIDHAERCTITLNSIPLELAVIIARLLPEAPPPPAHQRARY